MEQSRENKGRGLKRSESNPEPLAHQRNRSSSGSDLDAFLGRDVADAIKGGNRARSSSMLVGQKGQMGHKMRTEPEAQEMTEHLLAKLFRPDLRLRSPSFRVSAPRRVDTSHAIIMSPKLSPSISLRGMTENVQLPARIDSTGDVSAWSAEQPSPSDIGGGGSSQNRAQEIIEAVIYGVVNSILSAPAMYGYAAIIFRASFFQPFMPELSKLVLFSSVVHQVIFSLKSSLSFSIGQVQDAGLIFLSTMATSIASNAGDSDTIVPTTIMTLSVATALLGCAVYIIGRLRLAKLVSYLPMPVVGGYLAFIGFFCLEAGVGLSIGEDVSHFEDFSKAMNVRAMQLVAPAIVGGALLAVVAKKAEKWYSLPLCIVLLPLAFYVVLFFTNTSIAEAQDSGWLSKPRPGDSAGPFWEVWALFDLNKVNWSLLPKQIVTWVSMVFVVSFSSCLDVVAIEMDMGKELDINHELCTVGLSNIVSGCTLGYTGSYIFSQTIFTFRTNTNSRLVGLVVILFELGLFMCPYNVMEYVPLYFFAATLIFIAFDLLNEWLLEVRSKVSSKEYVVLMGTFLIITLTNDLMLGIFAGIGLAILNFIIAYSSVTHIERVGKTSSNVIRDFERRRLLARLQPQVARFDLHGFLFFGSSVQIVKKLQILLDERDRLQNGAAIASPSVSSVGMGTRSSSFLARAKYFVQGIVGGRENGNESLPLLQRDRNGDGDRDFGSIAVPPRGLPTVRRQSSWSEDGVDLPLRFLILDFTRVTGMDATAISTGLMRVKQIAIMRDITIVFTSLRPEFEKVLVANHVVQPHEPTDNCKVFEDEPDGLEWVENELLQNFGMEGRGSPKIMSSNYSPVSKAAPAFDGDVPEMPNIPFALNHDGSRNKVVMSLQSEPNSVIWLRRILVDFFGMEQSFSLTVEEPDLGEYQRLPEYFGLMRFREGDLVFRNGDPADSIFIVMVGEISLYIPPGPDTWMNKHTGAYWTRSNKTAKQRLLENGKLIQRARYGCIFGEIHFTLEENRQFSAVATEDAAVFFLSRARLIELQSRHPKLALGLFKCLTKSLSLTVCGLQQNYKGE